MSEEILKALSEYLRKKQESKPIEEQSTIEKQETEEYNGWELWYSAEKRRWFLRNKETLEEIGDFDHPPIEDEINALIEEEYEWKTLYPKAKKKPTQKQIEKYNRRMEKIEEVEPYTPEDREVLFYDQWEWFWKRVESKKVRVPVGVRIQFENAKDFIELLRFLKIVNDEATFLIKEDGLEYSMMDPSHIFMANVSINKYSLWRYEILYDNIDEFEVREEPAFTMVIDNLISNITNDDIKSSNGLFFEVNNKKAKVFSDTFEVEVDLLDTDYSSIVPKPKHYSPSKVAEINLRKLFEAIKNCEYIKLYTEKDYLIVESKSEFVAKKVVLGEALQNGLVAYYNAIYLKEMLSKALKLTKKAEIYFDTNKPLRISFKTNIAEIDYLIAPRIEEE